MAFGATTTYTAEAILPGGLGTLQAERADWAADFGGTLSTEGFEGLVADPGLVTDFGGFTLTYAGVGGLTLYGSNPLTRTEGAQGLGFSGSGSITLSFTSAINAFGIDWSSFDNAATNVSYGDSAGNVIADLFQPVTRSGAGFFGIIDTGGFSWITFDVTSQEIMEFDFIQYGVASDPSLIPLPAGLPLLVAGLGTLAVLRRRQG
ncbi:VPLPA-CTERM sorting domain-containing protein [Rhodovulum steppense]|nr:VPLPA-CTERM sorting domain-containing protein [Rhodovulum steppense]